jgi:two-component system, chemotaxis family, protein-glutamate methylesterase/glutaminase
MSMVAASVAQARGDGPIRVMVVDDAVVVRGLISRWLEEAGGFEVVARHRTGALAVADMERANPDVVILDIEMPDMDGIEALPLILKRKRNCAVIMASTLTRRSAEISLKCLSLGALDYVPKPESNRDITTSVAFRQQIVEKARHLGRRAHALRHAPSSAPFSPREEAVQRPEPGRRKGSDKGGYRAEQALAPAAGGFLARGRGALARQPDAAARPGIKLRPLASVPPRILLIGASTGGPQALNTLLSGIAPLIDRVPVLITQHMPATFTTILAEHLGRTSGKASAEAVHGEPIRPGRIYVAPGGRHMLVRRSEGHAVLVLDDGPPVNFCKPAVDPMFASAAQVFGAAVMAVVLTGMGSDGTQGAAEVVTAGGSVLAQDEATSVVWGMPGAVAQAGHCAALLPIDDIAPKLKRLFAGDRT